MSRIAVVGAGAWGRALGGSLAKVGAEVRYWTRDSGPDPLTGAEIVLVAVPAQATREVLGRIAPHLPAGVPLILTAKGLERETLARQSEIAAATAPSHPLAVLSGPGFAADLTAGLPTAVTLATARDDLQARLATPDLRPYLTDDLTGVEIGGALKNVVAIGCGIAIGAGLGESARAALMTRGFAEITRIGTALGARAETLSGLSGLGDLVLTATSRLSRNYRYGLSLGETGRPPAAGTYEGAATAGAAQILARRIGAETPVIDAVAAVIAGQRTVSEAVDLLYNRPLRRE